MTRFFRAALVLALLLGAGTWFVSAQQGGGAFVPTFAYNGISGFPRLFGCGTGTGDYTCANTASGMTAKIISGKTTLANGKAIVSGISPAFTSTTTGACVGQVQDAASGVTTGVQVVLTGVSSLQIDGTTTDVVWWQCVGY